jgi:hypothetical protein
MAINQPSDHLPLAGGVGEIIWHREAVISRMDDRAIQPSSMPGNKSDRRSHGCFENETREF